MMKKMHYKCDTHILCDHYAEKKCMTLKHESKQNKNTHIFEIGYLEQYECKFIH